MKMSGKDSSWHKALVERGRSLCKSQRKSDVEEAVSVFFEFDSPCFRFLFFLFPLEMMIYSLEFFSGYVCSSIFYGSYI